MNFPIINMNKKKNVLLIIPQNNSNENDNTEVSEIKSPFFDFQQRKSSNLFTKQLLKKLENDSYNGFDRNLFLKYRKNLNKRCNNLLEKGLSDDYRTELSFKIPDLKMIKNKNYNQIHELLKSQINKNMHSKNENGKDQLVSFPIYLTRKIESTSQRSRKCLDRIIENRRFSQNLPNFLMQKIYKNDFKTDLDSTSNYKIKKAHLMKLEKMQIKKLQSQINQTNLNELIKPLATNEISKMNRICKYLQKMINSKRNQVPFRRGTSFNKYQ